MYIIFISFFKLLSKNCLITSDIAEQARLGCLLARNDDSAGRKPTVNVLGMPSPIPVHRQPSGM
jgi:hypothetical protein